MRGPIDYIIVGFEGNHFDGSILRALGDAVDERIINVIALTVISIDAEGNTTQLGVENTGDDYVIEFANKYKVSRHDVTQADIDEMAELLQNNTTAGLLAIEHVWAKPLKQAILDAHGVLVAEGRIHPEAAEELNQTQEADYARTT